MILTGQLSKRDQSHREELTAIVRDWFVTESLLKTRDMVISSSDEKAFLIGSLAQMQANRRLLETLRKELGSIIPELMKIQSETVESIYTKIPK